MGYIMPHMRLIDLWPTIGNERKGMSAVCCRTRALASRSRFELRRPRAFRPFRHHGNATAKGHGPRVREWPEGRLPAMNSASRSPRDRHRRPAACAGRRELSRRHLPARRLCTVGESRRRVFPGFRLGTGRRRVPARPLLKHRVRPGLREAFQVALDVGCLVPDSRRLGTKARPGRPGLSSFRGCAE